MPQMFEAAGFKDTQLTIQLDRIYSKFAGPIGADQRRNYEDLFTGALQRLAHVVGGPEAAAKVFADWMDYIDRPDTSVVGTYWVAKATVPESLE